MGVTTGPYGGLLRITYKALPSGRLNYDLEFTPTLTGDYRLSFSWENLTDKYSLLRASSQLQVEFATKTYTFDWSDIPRTLATRSVVDQHELLLLVELGVIHMGSTMTIDPGYVDLSSSQMATAYTFQRKVFYDSVGSKYWAFYFDGYAVRYKYSSDGFNWLPTSGYYMPSGWPQWIRPANSMPSVYYANGQLVVASGYENSSSYVTGGQNIGVMEASVYYSIGTISGAQINWSPLGQIQRVEPGCTSFENMCLDVAGTRLVSVSADSSGGPIFSFNWYLSETPYNNAGTQCSYYYETSLIAGIRGSTATLSSAAGSISGCYNYAQDQIASVVTAADSSGGIRVVYQLPVYGYTGGGQVWGKKIDII
jgi:hypothetical protein